MAARNVRISTVKAERENPLLLETPSLVSSQTTAHVVNECFSKLLASRDLPWDNKSVSNLALSKTGDRLRHNNRLAEDLKEVSDRYEKKLEAIRCLEQQVQRARAQALLKEEQKLPTEGVPERDSVTTQSSHYVIDEQLLSQCKLLVPADYLPSTQPHIQPPREAVPLYFRSTHTSQQHSRIQPVAYCHTQTTSPTKVSKHPAVWKQSMSAETRGAEKGMFSELQRKSNFLSSQRNASATQMHTASSSQSKTKKQCPFAAQPNEVVFVDYQPGETYETFLDIHNISGASRQMRIVAPSSSFFTATLTYTPHPEGLIAPGMSSRYTIKFCPDSLCDFQDQLKVMSNSGECLCIPLRGSRQPPELNLPEVMDFGYCLTDQERSMVFHCCNNGGEGTFSLVPAEEESEKEEDESTCFLKPFSVSPSNFHLNRQESVDIHVTFHPKETGVFTRQLLVSCDNGQVKSFNISGEAEPLSVQCLSISDCSSLSAIDSNCSQLDNNQDDETNAVQFGLTNPGVPVYCPADIINTSHTELQYQWKLYHPQTELGSGAISSRVAVQPGDDTFTVDQWSGILIPQQRTTFKLCFNPTQEGVFSWCAYLQLEGVPQASLDLSQEGYEWVRVNEQEVAVVCLHMKGTALPYAVQFVPPLCVLPGHLLPASTARQPFKIVNHSLHAVHFHWRDCSTSHYTITVEASEGCIDADDSCECVVVVETKGQHCELVEDLVCCLDHSQLTLPIRALIEGPSVSVDEASVDFDLVAVSGVCSRSLSITNHSPASATVHLSQVVVDRQESISTTADCSTGQHLPIIDVDCLQFSPAVLELSPHSSAVASVRLGPLHTAGRLRTAIKCTTTGSTLHHVLEVRGEIQSPCVVLKESKLHVSPVYTGIPVEHPVQLINTSLLPTHYKWVGQLQHLPGIQLEVTPGEGDIGPRETVDLCLTMIFSDKGNHRDVVSGFTVDNMAAPLLLMSVSADVFGLSVEYHIENDVKTHHNDGSLVVDFGSHNPLGQPCSKLVTVYNSSAIHTHCSAQVSSFPSAPAPPAAQHALSVYNKTQKKSLLGKTANLADPLSKSLQQAEATLSTGLLAHGRGACFTVEPSQFDLAPFQSQAITITAYSDLWGQYTDTLHIEVDGLEEKLIPVNYGVEGCPIVFPSTATNGHTVVRMGCSCAGSDPIKRTLRLSNESCADVCVHWQIYTVYPNDDMLVDLLTAFGDPFSSSPPLSPCSTSSFAFSPRGCGTVESSPSTTHDCDGGDSGDGGIVRMYIRPHDGQLSHQPIAINHEHTVVAARSQTTVEILFTPSVEAYSTLGSAIHCYMLGYLTLQEQSPAGCLRETGYDIPPLRVDVLARIEYPVLALETSTEDHTLTFTYPASSLIEDEVLVDSVVTQHRITISNSSSTSVEFSVGCHTASFSVQLGGKDEDALHCLRPRQATTGVLTACLRLSDILQSSSADLLGKTCLTDTLTAVFSTGIKQEFPIVLSVILPQLEVSKSSVDYGVCFTEAQYTDHVLLSNRSQSGTLWSAVTSPEIKGIVSVSPSSGWLPPHLRDGQPSMCEVTITFTSRAEQCYDGSLTFSGSPGAKSLSVTLTGVGSSDESVLS